VGVELHREQATREHVHSVQHVADQTGSARNLDGALQDHVLQVSDHDDAHCIDRHSHRAVGSVEGLSAQQAQTHPLRLRIPDGRRCGPGIDHSVETMQRAARTLGTEHLDLRLPVHDGTTHREPRRLGW
jgi:hypothetical protein